MSARQRPPEGHPDHCSLCAERARQTLVHRVAMAFERAPVVPGKVTDEERAAVEAAAGSPWAPLTREELMTAIAAAPVDNGPIPEQERLDVEASSGGRWHDDVAVSAQIEARARTLDGRELPAGEFYRELQVEADAEVVRTVLGPAAGGTL
jgi:hypothetical protein